MSTPVTININALFNEMKFSQCHEMSLTANQPLSQVHRLQWNTVDSQHEVSRTTICNLAGKHEIQTVWKFECNYQPNGNKNFLVQINFHIL